jgi:hypothetical protein
MKKKATRACRKQEPIVRHDSIAHEIGHKLAEALFEAGNEPGNPCQRIEFKGGRYPENETANGGLCFTALSGFLARKLSAYLPNKGKT